MFTPHTRVMGREYSEKEKGRGRGNGKGGRVRRGEGKIFQETTSSNNVTNGKYSYTPLVTSPFPSAPKEFPMLHPPSNIQNKKLSEVWGQNVGNSIRMGKYIGKYIYYSHVQYFK